jgi:hypothetical protein
MTVSARLPALPRGFWWMSTNRPGTQLRHVSRAGHPVSLCAVVPVYPDLVEHGVPCRRCLARLGRKAPVTSDGDVALRDPDAVVRRSAGQHDPESTAARVNEPGAEDGR